MAMAEAMMAFQRQAAEAISACRAQLRASGHGFSPEDEAEIAAQAAAHPFPEGYDPNAAPSPDLVAQSEETAKRAMEATYPRDGFAPDDPRIAPIAGVPIALYAIAAKAIGWSTDEAFRARVVAALGIDGDAWKQAMDGFTQRVKDDIVVAAYYGQLFVAA